MSSASPLARLVHTVLAPSPALADLGLLFIRLSFGLSIALAHGLRKWPPSEKFIDGAAAMGFPAPELFAWLAVIGEVVGGFAIAIGFLTRPFAFLLLCTMATAFFVRHGADAFADKEPAMLFGVVALALLLGGAGRFSIDAVIAQSLWRSPRVP